MAAWEQDVIREVLAGNRRAYGRLVDEYQDPIRHSVARLLRDPETADDVTQDAFLAAYEHLDSFDPDGSFFSWLYRIAWNRALNTSRRESRQRPLGGRDFPTPQPSPEERLMAREQRADLECEIGRLPAKYVILLVLRHYLDFSYREMATLLELPLTTVRSRLHCARRMLAERLR